MSTLIVLGNTNQHTFANSIIAANAKSIELFDEPARDIFVIHSSESYRTLNTKTDWIDHLENNHVNHRNLTSKTIDLNPTLESVGNFVHHIETIMNGLLPQNPNVIVDLTNSTTLYKNLLSTAAYVLDLEYQYLIDTVRVSELSDSRGFLPLKMLTDAYIQVPSAIQLDDIAYLSLVEMVRYKRIIQKHTEKYAQIGAPHSNQEFFEKNLIESIRIKMRGDQSKENASHRIATSSIPASMEDLVSILIDKFFPAEDYRKWNKGTFGDKLDKIQSEMIYKTPANFDFEFFTKFNDFMRYLRNSSTHKSTDLTDIDKFKADLSIKMSFPFIEFYTDIIYPLLASGNYANSASDENIFPSKKYKTLSSTTVNPEETFYFGLDGDKTGANLEKLFLDTTSDEAAFKRMSGSVVTAIHELSELIKKRMGKNAVIFAAGDDMLFKAPFDEPLLRQMQQIYSDMTFGATCSIGYGRTFREVYFALKLAKKEPGENSIVGIELV